MPLPSRRSAELIQQSNQVRPVDRRPCLSRRRDMLGLRCAAADPREAMMGAADAVRIRDAPCTALTPASMPRAPRRAASAAARRRPGFECNWPRPARRRPGGRAARFAHTKRAPRPGVDRASAMSPRLRMQFASPSTSAGLAVKRQRLRIRGARRMRAANIAARCRRGSGCSRPRRVRRRPAW